MIHCLIRCIKWQCWFRNLKCLESFKVPRCIKPDGFGESVETELHHFSDASSLGYGQFSYVRMKTVKIKLHVHLLWVNPVLFQ